MSKAVSVSPALEYGRGYHGPCAPPRQSSRQTTARFARKCAKFERALVSISIRETSKRRYPGCWLRTTRLGPFDLFFQWDNSNRLSSLYRRGESRGCPVLALKYHRRNERIGSITRWVHRTSRSAKITRLTTDKRGSKVKEPLVDSDGGIYLVGP